MTSACTDPTYPQYCFHLSPTINRWCHVRASDIHALARHPGFEGQNLFFHLNHPIKWVRVAGIVVAIDEYAGRRIFTLDDSSGATIECVFNAPKPPEPVAAMAPAGAGATAAASSRSHRDKSGNAGVHVSGQSVPIDDEVDVGHLLDIKGGLRTFRDAMQLQVEKIVHLRSTQQEIQFWNKVTQLRQDVLSRPWYLDRTQIRRCRREAEGREAKDHNGKKRSVERQDPRQDPKARKATMPLRTGLEKATKRNRPPTLGR